MPSEKIDENKKFHPLGIAVLAVSDTRDFDSDTSGALLKDMLERDGHRLIDRAVIGVHVVKLIGRLRGCRRFGRRRCLGRLRKGRNGDAGEERDEKATHGLVQP